MRLREGFSSAVITLSLTLLIILGIALLRLFAVEGAIGGATGQGGLLLRMGILAVTACLATCAAVYLRFRRQSRRGNGRRQSRPTHPTTRIQR